MEFQLGIKSKNGKSEYCPIVKSNIGAPSSGWKFKSGSSKRKLQFSLNGTDVDNFTAKTDAVWEIIKLTESAFIIKKEDNGKTIRVEFENT